MLRPQVQVWCCPLGKDRGLSGLGQVRLCDSVQRGAMALLSPTRCHALAGGPRELSSTSDLASGQGIGSELERAPARGAWVA